MKRVKSRLRRWRLRTSRTFWPWAFVASTLACLWAWTSANAAIAAAGAVGCILSALCLWLLVTVRKDDLVDDIVAEASEGHDCEPGDDGDSS